MNVKVRVLDGKASTLNWYDLIIATVGFETRARFAHSSCRPEGALRLAIHFKEHHIFDFQSNEGYFDRAKFQRIEATDDAISQAIESWGCRQVSEDWDEEFIWVDISSLTRSFMARICYGLYEHAGRTNRKVTVHFAYSLASYSEPAEDYGPIIHKGAVIPEFSGWWDDPSVPCAAIFGIGYEAGLAVGVLEDLEPAETWVFRPTGHELAYDAAIDRSNREFFADLVPGHVLLYDIESPLALFASLEALVYGNMSSRKVVIIPFGLKMFALVSCLVAIQYMPSVNVWRVSGGSLIKPIDRIPSGGISALTAVFDGSESGMTSVSEFDAL